MTNNPKIANRFQQIKVDYREGSIIDLLVRVRNYVHRGHCLLTHPLSGSLKPGRIPYKTVALSAAPATLDLASLQHIENAMEAYQKTVLPDRPDWNKKDLDDYAEVDLSHIIAAFSEPGI